MSFRSKLEMFFRQMPKRLKEGLCHTEKYRDRLEELVRERTENLEQEITERQNTEEALRASSERLANIVDQSPMGIVIFDHDFKIREWNPSCEKIFGYSRPEILGGVVRKIVPEDARTHVDNVLKTLMKTRQSIRNKNKNITKDGRTIVCEWYNTPLTDSADQVIGMLSLVENVTERIRFEKELLKIKKLESTGVLAGGIAHDFNNILTAILGNINLSLLDPTLHVKTKELLIAAEKASIRAQTLTQQLLTFAKGGEPVKEHTSLVEIIRDSADFVLHGSATSCRYHFPDNLWLIEADKGQISQVIQNIVLNASQSMPGGGIINIACENIARETPQDNLLSHDSDYVKITIADSGVGIPPQVIEKIFDPYFSTKKEGSGLGLAITLSIVNKHQGHISVISEPGARTVFTIYLPANSNLQALETTQQLPKTPTSAARILVMDDEEMVLDVAGSMLTTLGHQVIFARNGDDCIRIYQEETAAGSSPDLVIMDLTIPGGKGGEETIRELLQINPKIKVVVSSGYSNDPIMSSYEKYGFRAAISKPYFMNELSGIIEKTLCPVNGK